MELLSWRSVRSPLLASGAMVALGCSFVLDTNDLHNGGVAGAGGTNQGATGGAGGAPKVDAATDAPVCSFADHDACSDCLGMHCCGELNACTHDPGCNLAYVDFQQCQRTAKKAANPAVAGAVCTETFRSRGGTAAAVFVGCTLTNCSTVCGG